jgi:hypothetical protein
MIDFASVQSLADSDVVRHGFFGRHGGVSKGDFTGPTSRTPSATTPKPSRKTAPSSPNPSAARRW